MKKLIQYKIPLGIISAFVVSFLFVFNVYSRQDKPNVLFITLDTLRSDHLGCYGCGRIKTPNIDRFARQGVMFKNTFSQVPLTFPSHVSLFTSTYPQCNNVRDNGSYRLDQSAVTLAEIMRKNNYVTAAFVSSIVLDAKYGLNQGFDTYDDQLDKNDDEKIIKFMDEERSADKVTKAAVKWLKQNKNKKFFLWVHYYDPHNLYNPPFPFNEIYRDDLYDGEIAFVDKNIGDLMETLKALNVDKNTLIIFTSDHGEGLGEHDESAHAVFVYDSTLHVPLIFYRPGVIPENKIVEQQVRLVDVLPTLLDLLGIKKNKEIQGVSLNSLIVNKKEKPLNLFAYSESLYANLRFNWSELKSIRIGEWKYIKSFEPELYNIKNDPHELDNVVEQNPDVVKKLDTALDNFLKKTTSVQLKESKMAIDARTKEQLKSLGYLQGTPAAGKGEIAPRKMVKLLEMLNVADRMANKGLAEEAIKLYKEILAADENNMEGNLHLAQCYKKVQKYDDAIKYFKKAASSKPEEPDVHDGLGNIYKSMGKFDEAFAEFEIAHRLEPDNAGIINNLGWYYQQKLEFDKAMEYYRNAIKLDNRLATTHVNMAVCYRIKGQLDKAQDELDAALKIDSNLAFAYTELCACTAIKGDWEQAVSYCQKGIDLAPQFLDGYVNIGVCYEHKRDYDNALKSYYKALEIAPWNVLVYCNIGNTFFAMQNFDKAREYYTKALNIDPRFRKAEEMLKRLDQQVNSR